MLIGDEQDWFDGEKRAWDILDSLNYDDIAQRSKATYHEYSRTFILRLFNIDLIIYPESRKILSYSLEADVILNRLSHYCRLPVLWYLIQAKDIPCSGRLINPSTIKGGQIFSTGTHTLPLAKIAERYGSDITRFLHRGTELGGRQLDYGDIALRLFPFPRIPVVLILWENDEEFPARADLLFDATCSVHLPVDIIWSTAMLCIQAMF